jgi:hypothetical protein
MRKDELVHLHTLLALVREEYERRDDPPPGTFEACDDLDVTPVAVYGSKADHQRAVKTLARGLATAVESRSGSRSGSGDEGVQVPSD